MGGWSDNILTFHGGDEPIWEYFWIVACADKSEETINFWVRIIALPTRKNKLINNPGSTHLPALRLTFITRIQRLVHPWEASTERLIKWRSKSFGIEIYATLHISLTRHRTGRKCNGSYVGTNSCSKDF